MKVRMLSQCFAYFSGICMQPLSHLRPSGPAGCNTIALTPGMFCIDFPQGKIKRAVGSPTAAGDLGRGKPPWLSPPEEAATSTWPRSLSQGLAEEFHLAHKLNRTT